MFKRTIVLLISLTIAFSVACTKGSEIVTPLEGPPTDDIPLITEAPDAPEGAAAALPTENTGPKAIVAKAAAIGFASLGFVFQGEYLSYIADFDHYIIVEPYDTIPAEPVENLFDINQCTVGDIKISETSCVLDDNCSQEIETELQSTDILTCMLTPALYPSPDGGPVLKLVSAPEYKVEAKFKCNMHNSLKEIEGCSGGSIEVFDWTMDNTGTPVAYNAVTEGDPVTEQVELSDGIYKLILPDLNLGFKLTGIGKAKFITEDASDHPSECESENYGFVLSAKEEGQIEKPDGTSVDIYIDLNDVGFIFDKLVCNQDGATFEVIQSKPIIVKIGEETYHCAGKIIQEDLSRYFCNIQ